MLRSSRSRLCFSLLAVALALCERASVLRADERLPATTEAELIERFDQQHAARGSSQAGETDFLSADAAAFDQWNPLTDDEPCLDCDLGWGRPMDRLRQWGFRHSSTHGRHVGRGLPLERSSWMNRPLHIDWFAGPLLSDQLVSNQVGQANDVLAGLRVGWDIDYYWGLDWRFGWSSPLLEQYITTDQIEGSYFVSDVDLVYYPWGDSKIRPYLLVGMGLTQLETVRPTGLTEDVTLLSTPFGGGVRFLQTPWLSWRLEILDNLAWGNDGVGTLNNFSFTAGMEFRLGGRPNSYWPWRSSRRSW